MHLDLIRAIYWTLAVLASLVCLLGLIDRSARKTFAGSLIASGVGCGLLTVFWLVRALIVELPIRMAVFNLGLMAAGSLLFIVAGAVFWVGRSEDEFRGLRA